MLQDRLIIHHYHLQAPKLMNFDDGESQKQTFRHAFTFLFAER